MRNGLGVGLGDKFKAERRKRAPELLIIFDDSVVNDGQMPADVGMAVGLGRLTVRGPPRMPDTRAAGKSLCRAAESLHPADAPANLHPAAVQQRDPGRIVAAVLQQREALEQNAASRLAADISDNPAHVTPRTWRRSRGCSRRPRAHSGLQARHPCTRQRRG